MHPSLSINTLCFSPGDLTEHVDAVARLGARGISPDLDQIIAIGPGQASRLLRDAHLTVATLTHRAFGFARREEATAARARLDKTLDIAAQIGAESITMTTGGRGGLTWSQSVGRFAEAVAPCAEKAQAAGIAIAIEPTSHLYAEVSIAHRLSDTVRIAQAAGISVTIDTFACWFDADIETSVIEAAPLTALVQVSDYVHGDRGLPCRAVPGDGNSGLDQLVPSIAAAGFCGWYDLEIIGPRIQAEGAEPALNRAATYLAAFMGSSPVAAQVDPLA